MDEQLKKWNPNLSHYSIRTYLSLFNTVVKNTVPFTNNKKWFLENKSQILDYINTLTSKHSKKSKLASVLVFAKSYGCTDEELKTYTDIINELAEQITTENKTHNMTDKMKDSWLTKDDLLNIIKKISKKLIKVEDVDEYGEYNDWMQYFILSMIVKAGYALRNDYANMKLINQPFETPVDKSHNYIIWNKKNNKVRAKLCLYQYKTHHAYGDKCYDITDADTLKIIPKVSAILPAFSTDGFILCKRDKTAITQDQYSKWLSAIFRNYAGKTGVASTMLRHIIASSQYTPEEIQQMENLEDQSDKMQHSLKQSFDTYVKKE